MAVSLAASYRECVDVVPRGEPCLVKVKVGIREFSRLVYESLGAPKRPVATLPEITVLLR